MPRLRETVPVDDYVLDVLMRDLVGHDHQPAAFLVYLYLYRQAQRSRWHTVTASLRMVADNTGLSKSAVQIAFATLRRRQLVKSRRAYRTATPKHQVLRHWRSEPDWHFRAGLAFRARTSSPLH
jgi:DNA-binding transcriptional MocR family regulator